MTIVMAVQPVLNQTCEEIMVTNCNMKTKSLIIFDLSALENTLVIFQDSQSPLT